MNPKISRKWDSQLLKKGSSKKIKPLSDHRYAEFVTTIGYKQVGLRNSDKVFSDYQKDSARLKEFLGGKAAGLAMMSQLKLPIPPAFNIAAPVCEIFLNKQRLPESLVNAVNDALRGLEKNLGRVWGDSKNPLLVSVRSGARVSMPGMMDTILNLGLNRDIVEGLASNQPHQARFWWDCYRRFLQMFSDVVLKIEKSEFDHCLRELKKEAQITADQEMDVDHLKTLVQRYEELIKSHGKVFPTKPTDQLLMAIESVFRSWNTDRAVHYRSLNHIPDQWGTSVTVQSMVYGNRDLQSGTGVVFTRNPSTGEKSLYGEYLLNAQGEDVVAGIRTPQPISDLKAALPKVFRELNLILSRLEKYYRDVQDIEFTVESGRLFILQTRTAKRTAFAACEHWFQLSREKLLSQDEVLQKISYDQVKQLLHPTLKETTEKPLAQGLPASPGAVAGRIALSQEQAVRMNLAGQPVILVRQETSPEDIMGMSVSEGILTATGGMTSHAAVVARGMGKTCVVGCQDLQIVSSTTIRILDSDLKEGDWITLDGSSGRIFSGTLATEPVKWTPSIQSLFKWADERASMPVFVNADTPEQASTGRSLGAQGIGLCRTEHMFFDKERIHIFRWMILSEDADSRKKQAQKLSLYQENDFFEIFKSMRNLSVCVRLLDPPLHEFLPHDIQSEEAKALMSDLEWSAAKLESRIHQLSEMNPMLGHRGCRLGITFPEIYEMQVRALARAFLRAQQQKIQLKLKIMLPLIMNPNELELLLKNLKKVFLEEAGLKMAQKILWGTMIELPRACLVAGDLARQVDFFSFGTNDLTQTSLGFSRDDSSKFMAKYLELGVLKADPFESLDQEGVGQLIQIAVEKGRQANPRLEIGICGEHGGDPSSIEFFNRLKLDSVSCSPFRVPMARLALAHAELASKNKARGKR